MAQLSEHPTVKHFHEQRADRAQLAATQVLDGAWLRQLCLDAGADDVGFVESDRPEIADQKADIQWLFPRTKTLISFVCRMNRENVRTPSRSIANLEFHHTTDHTNEVARRIVAALERMGVGAINGGAAGGTALHYDDNGGTMVLGDALINFEPHGFGSLPAKYCLNRNLMHRSLRKLLDYAFERMLFAHGTPILTGARARVEQLLAAIS